MQRLWTPPAHAVQARSADDLALQSPGMAELYQAPPARLAAVRVIHEELSR